MVATASPDPVAVFEKHLDEKRSAALVRYAKLVRDLLAGPDAVDPSYIDEVCHAAAKSPDDLRNDLCALHKRHEFAKRAATRPKLESELQTETNILAELEAEFERKAVPLREQKAKHETEVRKIIENVESHLRDSAPAIVRAPLRRCSGRITTLEGLLQQHKDDSPMSQYAGQNEGHEAKRDRVRLFRGEAAVALEQLWPRLEVLQALALKADPTEADVATINERFPDPPGIEHPRGSTTTGGKPVLL